jgi:hypothetical protein
MSTSFGYDIVRGTVIGPIEMQGQLFYEGKPQGGTFQGETDQELKREAGRRKNAIRRDCGRAFEIIFPNLGGWELRIWD